MSAISFLKKWGLIPFAVGLLARFGGVFVAFVIFKIASYLFHNDLSVRLNEPLSAFVPPSQRPWVYLLTILVFGPIIENIVIVLSGEWLRSAKWMIIVACVVSGTVSYFYHGIQYFSVAAAIAFVIYTYYYIKLRNNGDAFYVAFILTSIAHSFSNLSGHIAGSIF